MSCDKLVFDLAQEIEGTPNIFVKKDWLNILDNQNGNYGSNQSVVDTSQLTNSNKYLSYREAYLQIPLLLTLASSGAVNQPNFGDLATPGSGKFDYGCGLKNWFGQIIHSFTVDYNGTTIIQQTPYVNMWNSFKLMTTLSWSDVATMGATIGFYPDDPTSWAYNATPGLSGQGLCNNTVYQTGNGLGGIDIIGGANNYNSGNGNIGLLKRISYVNYAVNGDSGTGTYDSLLSINNTKTLWKSYIVKKLAGTTTTIGLIQYAISATVYLKHIHSFFQMVPLLKGVYMKMTMNLNNCSATVGVTGTEMTLTGVTNAVGGICPFMMASGATNNPFSAISGADTFTVNLSVGSRCLNNTLTSTNLLAEGPLPNIYLYVPGYTFNPVFEEAYLSNPVKKIQYTDIYQYQVLNVGSNSQVNNLLTNGIANIKSVLILPFFTQIVPGGTGANALYPWLSPFDPAGSGPTSPLCLFSNFNVVVSGQNMIYNTERYAFEHFNNQLYGVNAVNGGMTDGLTSGLIDRLAFDMNYCYYYVDVSRMLPVEESVPKSVQVVGTNQSGQPINLWCFIEYGMEVNIDLLTGAKV